MKDTVKAMKARQRKERIDQLGGFGTKRTQVIKDKSKYTRKTKHKDSDHGSFSVSL